MQKFTPLVGFALMQAIAAANTVAQETGDSAFNDLLIEEIVVTANKRKQVLQEVPMSISAFSKDFFKDSGETNFNALEQYTPSLKIQSGPDSRTTSIRIRGIGSAGSNTGIDPSVGVFVDGVYQGRAGMNISDLVDIERVEVLRGPQGTLYGKNTAAGAINVITARPSTVFEGNAELNYTSDKRTEVRGMINVPLGESGHAARISAFAINGDHLYKNTYNGEDLNDANKWGLKSRVLLNLDDSTLLISADYSRENTDCCAMAVIDYDGYSPIMIGTPMTGNQYTGILGFIPHVDLESVTGLTPPKTDPFGDDYWLNDELSNDVEVAGLSAEWNFDLANQDTITFINAARSYRSISSYDSDFSAYDAASPADTDVKMKQFSSELRITSPGGATWDYQGGLYAYYSKIESEGRLGMNETILLNSPSMFGQPPLSAMLGSSSVNVDSNEHITTSLAAFGQLTWNITEQLSTTVGLRITQEDKERTGSQRTLRTPITIMTPGGPFEIPLPPMEVLPDLAPIAGADVDFDQERTDTNVSPAINLRYFWNDDFMTYASVSKGFKSGGFDQRRVAIQTHGAINGGNEKAGEFDEEEAISYELGWKSALLNNRLTFNGTFYFVDYDDFQAQAFDGASTTVTNAGSLESYGAEIDARFVVNKNLTLGTAIGYNKAEYKDFDNGQCSAENSLYWSLLNPTVPCVQDLAGQPLDNAPEWTVSSFAQYQQRLNSDLVAIARIEHNYVDAFYLDQDLDENLYNDDVDLLNLRFTITNNSRDWEVAMWGKNILDEKYYLMGIDIPTIGGFAGVVAPRATYGITFRRNFN